MTVLKAGAAHFALVFAVAFAFDTLRVLIAEPPLGETGAVLLEAPALLLVVLAAARWSVALPGAGGLPSPDRDGCGRAGIAAGG